MTKLLKILLVWLCVLSLPVQGMAAVTRLSCGTAHHHPVNAEQRMHEHHAHGDGRGDHAASHHQPSADKCSVCASCCSGLGMVATFTPWLVPSHEHAVLVATFQRLLPSYLPDGLERPPRSILA